MDFVQYFVANSGLPYNSQFCVQVNVISVKSYMRNCVHVSVSLHYSIPPIKRVEYVVPAQCSCFYFTEVHFYKA